MVLVTKLTRALGIRHPIVQGGMHHVGFRKILFLSLFSISLLSFLLLSSFFILSLFSKNPFVDLLNLQQLSPMLVGWSLFFFSFFFLFVSSFLILFLFLGNCHCFDSGLFLSLFSLFLSFPSSLSHTSLSPSF